MENATAPGAAVTVFSTETCGWCRRAEDLLRRSGIPFDVVDVTGNRAARAALAERTGGWQTVAGGLCSRAAAIGGYRELAALVNTGALKHLVQS